MAAPAGHCVRKKTMGERAPDFNPPRAPFSCSGLERRAGDLPAWKTEPVGPDPHPKLKAEGVDRAPAIQARRRRSTCGRPIERDPPRAGLGASGNKCVVGAVIGSRVITSSSARGIHLRVRIAEFKPQPLCAVRHWRGPGRSTERCTDDVETAGESTERELSDVLGTRPKHLPIGVSTLVGGSK